MYILTFDELNIIFLNTTRDNWIINIPVIKNVIYYYIRSILCKFILYKYRNRIDNYCRLYTSC